MHFGLFREMIGSAKELMQRLKNFVPPIPWFGQICSQAYQLFASSSRFWGCATYNRGELS